MGRLWDISKETVPYDNTLNFKSYESWKILTFFHYICELLQQLCEPSILALFREQSVFITWGGSEEFRGVGWLEIGLPKGGVDSLKDFVEVGFKKYILSSWICNTYF